MQTGLFESCVALDANQALHSPLSAGKLTPALD